MSSSDRPVSAEKRNRRAKRAPKLEWKSPTEYVPLYPRPDRRELISLDSCLRRFILPRLKLYRKNISGHPCSMTLKRWEWIIDEMIYGFEYLNDDWVFEERTYTRLKKASQHIKGGILAHPEVKKVEKRALRGRKLFAEYIGGMWL